jgi:PAS domain S-box-containing protein
MEKTPQSEQKYRHLFQNLFDAVLLADSKTGRLLDANKKAEELLGYTHDEIISMHQSQLHPPGKAEEYQHRFTAHIKQGHAADYEGEVVTKDGSIVPVYISAAPFTVDGVDMIMGLFRDITWQKKAEQALKEERDKAKNYLDIAGVIILAINAEGYITLINKKGCEVLGYKEEEIIGKNWFDSFIPSGIKDELLGISGKLLVEEIEPAEYHENPEKG